MRTVIDAALRLEASTYRLRFTCEHCAHFDASRAACAEGYPSEPHRDVQLEAPAEGEATGSLEFCKSFELV